MYSWTVHKLQSQHIIECILRVKRYPGRIKSHQAEQKSKKIHPLKFSDIFPKWLGIFGPNFTRLLCVPIYAGLQFCIQLPATLSKLCHVNRDHNNVLKIFIIDRNACWVVTLNMA